MMLFNRFLKFCFKTTFKLQHWIDQHSWVKARNTLVKDIHKNFLKETKKSQISFDYIVQKLRLSESDLLYRQSIFSRLITLLTILFSFILSYGFYLAYYQLWLSFCIALTVSSMVLVKIFQYHFWLFQLKDKKLGQNFSDWFDASFRKRSMK